MPVEGGGVQAEVDRCLCDLGVLWHQQGAALTHRTQMLLYLLSLGPKEALGAARAEAQRLRWLLEQTGKPGERGKRGAGHGGEPGDEGAGLGGERGGRGAKQELSGKSIWAGLAKALGASLGGAWDAPV